MPVKGLEDKYGKEHGRVYWQTKEARRKKRYGRGVIKENMQIYALMLPTLVLIFIFCYIPMYGLVIAFQDYVPGAPFLGEGVKWVGLRWFDKFISGHYFSRLIKILLS